MVLRPLIYLASWLFEFHPSEIKIIHATCCRFQSDGGDHMGEHKDDEEELVKGSPIASLSLGQERDFVFRHQDARGASAKVGLCFIE